MVQWTTFALHARNKSKGGRQLKSMRNANTATMIGTTILEDAPQVYFLFIYVTYMGVFNPETELADSTKQMVVFSFIMSALSMLGNVNEIMWRIFCRPSAKQQPNKEHEGAETVWVNPAYAASDDEPTSGGDVNRGSSTASVIVPIVIIGGILVAVLV